MLAAVTAINRQICDLAPVLNSPSITNGVFVESTPEDNAIAWMLKRRGETAYVFAVNLRNRPTKASFVIRDSTLSMGRSVVTRVMGEARNLPVRKGGSPADSSSYEMADDFKPLRSPSL